MWLPPYVQTTPQNSGAVPQIPTPGLEGDVRRTACRIPEGMLRETNSSQGGLILADRVDSCESVHG